VGERVMAYVTKRKLTLAGQVLLETDAAIVDIAVQFGYDSREGFSRSFKAYMGISPGEYRKYGLSAIAQKRIQERVPMTQNTDAIMRELNNFIVKAKETAEAAQKEAQNKNLPHYADFWQHIARKADHLAGRVQSVLTPIAQLAENRDEITYRFTLLKVIEDTAFESNVLAFNVGLMVSRHAAEPEKSQQALVQKFMDLAVAAVQKSGKMRDFLAELSALVYEDIKKSYTQKMQEVIEVTQAAVAAITDYQNIKNEVTHLTQHLAQIPFNEHSAAELEDCLFRLNLLIFAAEMDTFRSPQDAAQFAKMTALKDMLADAQAFTEALPTGISPTPRAELTPTAHKQLQDMAFQGNLLLFYLRGEAEKMNRANLLSAEQNKALNAAEEKINAAIHIAQQAEDLTAAALIVQNYITAIALVAATANALGSHGNALHYINGEIVNIATRAKGYSTESAAHKRSPTNDGSAITS